MDHDILAVADEIKVDARTLQLYISAHEIQRNFTQKVRLSDEVS